MGCLPHVAEGGGGAVGGEVLAASGGWTGKEIVSLEPPRGHSSADFMASHRQKGKIINVGCFKPQCLWSFLTAAIGN